MKRELFNSMELDAIGEVMNISLGASATAVSNLLDHRVEISTPDVSSLDVGDFSISDMDALMGVEIEYTEGLEGMNIMLLRRSDIKALVDILNGTETPEEEFELNDMTVSAVCELMNQMMGAASTAMADFLGFPVNISTPKPFEFTDSEDFKEKYLSWDIEKLLVARITLRVEGVLESEFINIMSVDLVKELLKGFELDEEGVIQKPAPSQTERRPAPEKETASEPQESYSQRITQNSETDSEINIETNHIKQEEVNKQMAPNTDAEMNLGEELNDIQQPQAAPVPQSPVFSNPFASAAYPEPKIIQSKAVDLPEMNIGEMLGREQSQNLDLIMEVPVQVTVEIGRTQRKVQDVLEFSKGSLVVLDKLAGDQVDLFVNGKRIAKGDVVVVDDNFGVRITEIVQRQTEEKVRKK